MGRREISANQAGGGDEKDGGAGRSSKGSSSGRSSSVPPLQRQPVDPWARLETSSRCLRLSLSLSLSLHFSLSLSKTKSSRCSRQCQGGTDGRAGATAAEEDPLDWSRWWEWREVVVMAPGRNLEIPPSWSIPQFLRSTRLHLDNLAFRCLRRSLEKISKESLIKSF